MPNRGKRDGKGLEGAEAWALELQKTGRILKRMEHLCEIMQTHNLFLKQVKFVCKDDEGNDWLGIVTADGDNGAVISFHGASSFIETLHGIISRIENNSMKWRTDEYSSA